jgi:hypothetical protein
MNPTIRRWLLGCSSLAVATGLWLPLVHRWFEPPASYYYSAQGAPPKARELAARHLDLWTDPALKSRELERMRRSNAEWDFMGRSFLVWSLANLALREPDRQVDYLSVMDQIIDETIRLEQEEGIYFFLMNYAKARPFIVQPARSLFLDSEIALMLAVRRVIAEKADYRTKLTERIEAMASRMRQNPLAAAESYPDECWLFDHAVALAAFRLADFLDGTRHQPLIQTWLAAAKASLLHPATGLLVSAYNLQGKAADGPEGSSIWMAAHCLQLVDEAFARDQYDRARRELGRVVAGFGYSREWPVSWQGMRDVDAGAVIPWLEISAGGSGLAFVGAASFRDLDFLKTLSTTLDFAAFPQKKQGRLRYCGSNPVGDAVLLYSTVMGPLWEKVRKGNP